MSLWFWVKSWDIGFALVMIVDQILYYLLPKQPYISDRTFYNAGEALYTVLQHEPNIPISFYYSILGCLLLAVPVVSGFIVKRGGSAIVGTVTGGINSFSSTVGGVYAQGARSLEEKRIKDPLKGLQSQATTSLARYQSDQTRPGYESSTNMTKSASGKWQSQDQGRVESSSQKQSDQNRSDRRSVDQADNRDAPARLHVQGSDLQNEQRRDSRHSNESQDNHTRTPGISPGHETQTSQKGGNSPEHETRTSQKGGDSPEHETRTSQKGGDSPEREMHTSQKGGDSPEHETHTSQKGGGSAHTQRAAKKKSAAAKGQDERRQKISEMQKTVKAYKRANSIGDQNKAAECHAALKEYFSDPQITLYHDKAETMGRQLDKCRDERGNEAAADLAEHYVNDIKQGY